MVLIMTDTRSVHRHYRRPLEEFLSGRISYAKLVNLIDLKSSEIDRLIADVVCDGLKHGTKEAVLRN